MCSSVADARFVPRHDDELELEVNDPLLVEVQGEDYWYEGYNMRTGARGIFPAYYAMEITKDAEHFKEGISSGAQHPSLFLWRFKWPASGLARRDRGPADFAAIRHLLGFHYAQLGRGLATVTDLLRTDIFTSLGCYF